MEEILTLRIKKHHKPHVVEEIDVDGHLKRKYGRKLVAVSVNCKETQLSKKQVSIGSEASKIINLRGVISFSVQFDCFLIKYFIVLSLYLHVCRNISRNG